MAYVPPHKRNPEMKPTSIFPPVLPKFAGSFNDPGNKLTDILVSGITSNPTGMETFDIDPYYENMYYNQYQKFTPEEKVQFKEQFLSLEEMGILKQYKNIDELFSNYFNGKNQPAKSLDKMHQKIPSSPLSLRYSYPIIPILTGFITRDINDPIIKHFSTKIYRFDYMIESIKNGNLSFSSLKLTDEREILKTLIIQPYRGISDIYPFLNGLSIRLYDKFLNTNDLGLIFKNINSFKKFSVNNGADVLWDLTYTLINFNLGHKFVENPYTNATGCGINTLYLFELITKQEAIDLSIQHFKSFGLYGSPLLEISKYFNRTNHNLGNPSNIINIPIIGSLSEKLTKSFEFFTELATCLKERYYTFIKLFIRLDNTSNGHMVGIIKIDKILYVLDSTNGFISYINHDILNYYFSIYDGIQIMSSVDISPDQQSQFDIDITTQISQYQELDVILENKNKEGLCKEYLKLKFPNPNNLTDKELTSAQSIFANSEYEKLDEPTINQYAMEYLNWKSDQTQKKINEIDLELSRMSASLGGKKISKKFKKISKISKKFQKKTKKFKKNFKKNKNKKII
jgi:hypothetical protein